MDYGNIFNSANFHLFNTSATSTTLASASNSWHVNMIFNQPSVNNFFYENPAHASGLISNEHFRNCWMPFISIFINFEDRHKVVGNTWLGITWGSIVFLPPGSYTEQPNLKPTDAELFMEFDVVTTTVNEPFEFMASLFSEDAYIDWGDNEITYPPIMNPRHNYAVAGTYRFKLYGACRNIDFSMLTMMNGVASTNAAKVQGVMNINDTVNDIDWLNRLMLTNIKPTEINTDLTFRTISNISVGINNNVNLKKVNMPNQTTFLSNMFQDCTALENAIFGADMVDVPIAMFYNCQAFESFELFLPVVTISNSTENSGSFGHLYKLTEATEKEFPVLTNVGDWAFQNCINLEKVDFPEATRVGIGAFSNCSSLSEVNLPKITTINNTTFRGCASLTKATEEEFPLVTSLGLEAFSNCSNLSEISFPLVVSTGAGTSATTGTFGNCTSLTEINVNTLPSLTTLGAWSFSGCSNLTDVTLPNVIGNINEASFSNCVNLLGVSFPEATTVGVSAFTNCDKLENIVMPKVTTISNGSFQNCASLETVSFPEAITINGVANLGAFQSCTSLNKISFPKVTTIGIGAFALCNSLTKITSNEFPMVINIHGNTNGQGAFRNCANLQEVDLPTVTNLQQWCFTTCPNLGIGHLLLISIRNVYIFNTITRT